jgi:ABC-2 type transport system ATP-binding protein
LDKEERVSRAAELMELVGLSEAVKQNIHTFSKGMNQRIGLAMAMLHRPKLLFLDEPTSGLDPFGRLLVRDVIRLAREEGTTVFLNSHLLGEVEVTCDRVAFIRGGRVIKAGTIASLSGGLVKVRIKVDTAEEGLLKALEAWGERITPLNKREIDLILSDESRLPDLNAWLVGQGLKVYALAPHHLSLEELFIEIMGEQAPEEKLA